MVRADGAGSAILVRRSCETFAAAACAGTATTTFSAAEQILLSTGGSWLTFVDNFTMPAATFSARCRLDVVGLGPAPLDVYFDEARLTTAGATTTIFKDGFESGNTSAWSSVTP